MSLPVYRWVLAKANIIKNRNGLLKRERAENCEVGSERNELDSALAKRGKEENHVRLSARRGSMWLNLHYSHQNDMAVKSAVCQR